MKQKTKLWAGFPAGFNAKSHAHFGIDLVFMLVGHDLPGSVTFTNRTDQKDGGVARAGRVEIIFSEEVLFE